MKARELPADMGCSPRESLRSEPKSRSSPCFVGQVMRRKPYRTAKRIVDNASIHRGKASVEQQWNSVLPSWLNQVDLLLYRSKKGPHPERLLGTRRHPFPSLFERYYEDTTLSMEIHPQRPQTADETPCRIRTSSCFRRLTVEKYVTELSG